MLAAPSAALADVEYPPPRPPEHFGRRGQIVVDELVGVRTTNVYPAFGALSAVPMPFSGAFMAYTASSEQYGTKSTTSAVSFRPSVDYFITDTFSIGGSITAAFSKNASTRRFVGEDSLVEEHYRYRGFGLAVEPRAGVVFRLAESLSLWSRVGAGFYVMGTSYGRETYVNEGTLSLFSRVGLVASLTRFAYLEVGPEARLNVLVAHEDGPPRKATGAALGVSGALGLMFLRAPPSGRPRSGRLVRRRLLDVGARLHDEQLFFAHEPLDVERPIARE